MQTRGMRALLAGLIVISTVAFVVGTTIERNSGDVHHESPQPAGEHASEAGDESGAEHAAEGGAATTGRETHSEELKPLGIDIEAAPFVIAAALVSLALAFAVWRRPAAVALLVLVAGAMLLFAALDVREVFHQGDEDRTGLAVLAAAVAVLHLAAAAVAATMATRAAHDRSLRPGRPAATGR